MPANMGTMCFPSKNSMHIVKGPLLSSPLQSAAIFSDFFMIIFRIVRTTDHCASFDPLGTSAVLLLVNKTTILKRHNRKITVRAEVTFVFPSSSSLSFGLAR